MISRYASRFAANSRSIGRNGIVFEQPSAIWTPRNMDEETVFHTMPNRMATDDFESVGFLPGESWGILPTFTFAV